MFIKQSMVKFNFKGFTIGLDFFYGKDNTSLFISSGWTCNNNTFIYRPGQNDKFVGSWERYDETKASEYIVSFCDRIL